MTRINEVTNSLSPRHGYSIYDRHEFSPEWPEPRRIMFIYIRVNRNQTLVVDQYVSDMPEGETLDDAERRLLDNARPGPRDNPHIKNPPRLSEGFDHVTFGWTPCYVTMVIDDEFWKFHPWPDNQFEETIVFRRDKLLVKPDEKGELQPEKHEFEPNYSFFNFERGAIRGRQSVRFVNFMRQDAEGTPISPEPIDVFDPANPKWEHCMDVYIRMPYNFSQSSGDQPTHWLTLVFDPPQDNGGSGGPPKPN
jgi:hypothetical protein